MELISLVPSVFVGRGIPGDFEWEIRTGFRGGKALYIFNDNVADHRSSVVGGGNAAIRPYNRYGYAEVMSAGVSTGWSSEHGGFRQLTQDVRSVIQDDVSEISSLLSSGKYTQLVYSTEANNSDIIGTGIFEVCHPVKRYIVSTLRQAVQHARNSVSFNKTWGLVEIAEVVCDGLVRDGRVGLMIGTQRRDKRIASLINLFNSCGIDGAKMSCLNIRNLEASWHAHAKGEKWESSALSVLSRMLADFENATNVGMIATQAGTQRVEDYFVDPYDAVKHLVLVQKREFPKIMEELKRYGRKRTHWIWWVFPTEHPGACDEENTYVTRQTAPHLCNSKATEEWLAILEKICDLVEEANTCQVVPGDDHGRIRYFLQFWKSLPNQPDRMTSVLRRLDECEWLME
jgi:hypothetical protein